MICSAQPLGRKHRQEADRTIADGGHAFHHPLVGDLELDFEAFELPGDLGQRINIYTAPPDSPSAESLDLLASWTARGPGNSTIDAPSSTRNEETWNS